MMWMPSDCGVCPHVHVVSDEVEKVTTHFCGLTKKDVWGFAERDDDCPIIGFLSM